MKPKSALRKKIIIALLCTSIIGTVLLTGCNNQQTETSSLPSSTVSSSVNSSESSNVDNKNNTVNYQESSNSTVAFEDNDLDTSYDENNATKIKLSSSSAEISGNGASVKDSTITISSAGTYIVSGTADNCQIEINAGKNDVVKLVLDNASLTSKTAPAIYSSKAKKTIILLPDGTSSTLSDGSDYFTETSSSESSDTSETDNSSQPNAALYCQDDLTILGNGTLTVNGNAHNGITSKDILRITSGTINVNSKNHGITGKDNLAIEGGTLKITSGGDGIRSTYAETDDSSKGHIFIENADISITSQNDGIQAEKNLIINNGTFNIKTGDGAESNSKANSSTNNGGFHEFPNNTQTTDSSTSVSQKGIKSGNSITVNNGTFTLDTYDDAIHTNGNIEITGGTFDIKTGDDGVHADDTLTIKNGTITVSQSYEGLEATTINITGGTVDIKSSDDGINSAGGNDSSGFGGFGGRPQDKFMNQTNTDNQTETDDTKQSSMTISGGTIYINADGDGIDSNNKILISGGTIVVNGTTSTGDGIIDHDGDCEITGGTLIGSGTYGMLEMPESTSTQNSVAIMMTQTQKAETPVYIADSKGNILVLMAPQKDYSCIVFSSPQLKTGETYTVYVGGTASGESTNGYYTQTSIKDGTKYTEFIISESVTYVNESGVTTYSGMGGGKGNRQPMSPDGTKPDMPNGERPERPSGNIPEMPNDIPADMPDNTQNNGGTTV